MEEKAMSCLKGKVIGLSEDITPISNYPPPHALCTSTVFRDTKKVTNRLDLIYLYIHLYNYITLNFLICK